MIATERRSCRISARTASTPSEKNTDGGNGVDSLRTGSLFPDMSLVINQLISLL